MFYKVLNCEVLIGKEITISMISFFWLGHLFIIRLYIIIHL
jgi:hypothetical protein